MSLRQSFGQLAQVGEAARTSGEGETRCNCHSTATIYHSSSCTMSSESGLPSSTGEDKVEVLVHMNKQLWLKKKVLIEAPLRSPPAQSFHLPQASPRPAAPERRAKAWFMRRSLKSHKLKLCQSPYLHPIEALAGTNEFRFNHRVTGRTTYA